MRRREVVRFVEIASTSSGNATSSSPSCPFSRARFLSPAVIARGGSQSSHFLSFRKFRDT
eukprot:31237-Pelagococcus_subviridis.AAC.15